MQPHANYSPDQSDTADQISELPNNSNDKKKLITELEDAKKNLEGLSDRDKNIASREGDYIACVTYFLSASTSLWFGGAAYCFFQYKSARHGIFDLGVPIIAANIFSAFFTAGDWVNNTFGISPTNDSDKLALSPVESNEPSHLLGKLALASKYIVNNPVNLALIDIPFFIAYFTGSSASFSSILPYLLQASGDPKFGTLPYYSVIAFDFIMTIAPGLVYYYAFNSRPLEKTQKAWETFRGKRWDECDINAYRICEALCDSTVVVFYRSIWLAGISTIFLEALEIPITPSQKFFATMVVLFCAIINVALTRCVNTAAPYFDYDFSAISTQDKKKALNTLSYNELYCNLNVVSGLTTSAGIALMTYASISKNKNIALPVAVLLGLCKLFISIMAQRDLASCQKALLKDSSHSSSQMPTENRRETAKQGFSALANTFKEDAWIGWFITMSTSLGRAAKLSGFTHFTVSVSTLAKIELSFLEMIALLLIVVIANARNEFRTYRYIMSEIISQKIAEAYVQYHEKRVELTLDDSTTTPLLTDQKSDSEDNSVNSFSVGRESADKGCDARAAQTEIFNSMCVLFPWKLPLYYKGIIDTTPNTLARAIEARIHELNP
jgi:hypothetical protein